MSEKKPNKVLGTFRIEMADADWAAAEQRRLRREHGKIVTQADFFGMLRDAWRGYNREGESASEADAGTQPSDPLTRVEAVLKELLGEPWQTDSNAGAKTAGRRSSLLRLIEAIEESTRRQDKSTRRLEESNRKATEAIRRLQGLLTEASQSKSSTGNATTPRRPARNKRAG
jgi:hypothetical protein